ncbi:DUF1758 domain-containing protein [Trichonephila clavipes]|nr:DUF1758 domain-containing protein [Trichonephila clavipes]
MLKQLPHDLVVEFHRQKDSKDIGDVRELMKVIKFEIESRESANIALGHSQKIPENSRYPPRNLSYQRQQPKFKHNIPSYSALTTVIKNVCIFCNSDTPTSIGCQIFSNEEKRYKLKKEGRYYRCMTYRHLISQCKVKITPCETYQSLQHNSLFCPKTKTKTPLLNNSIEIPEIRNVKNPETETQVKEIAMSSVLNPSCSPENYATLLQTAEVQVINGCNKVMARGAFIFHSGSQKSFIRSASKFKPFVSNKISEIQENIDPASWRHCSGKQNPADLLTRGLTSNELINSEKWWHGPEWLKDSENLWSKLEGFESLDSETVELKSSLTVNLTITHERIIDPDKYSSLLKLLRITAYNFRFVNALGLQKDNVAKQYILLITCAVTRSKKYSS